MYVPGGLPVRLVASAYVLAVAVLATLGFTVGPTAVILVAALVTLPASLVAVPGYYLAVGLLAQVPGASPSQATGTASCDPGGACREVTTGDPAAWFTTATDAIGVLALVAAGVLNVVLLARVVAARRVRTERAQPRA